MAKTPFFSNPGWVDLDPADTAARVKLRQQLRAHSKQRGWTEQQLSLTAGHRAGWAQSIWGQDSWQMSSIQTMVRALGFRLEFGWDKLLPPHMAPPDAVLWETMAAAYPAGGESGDALERLKLADTARRLREALGITAEDVGKRLMVRPVKVTEWETGDKADYPVNTAQRHFRAIGYPLSFTLADENGDPVPDITPMTPKPPRKRSAGSTTSAPVTEVTPATPTRYGAPERCRITYNFDAYTVTLHVGDQSLDMGMDNWYLFTRSAHCRCD